MFASPYLPRNDNRTSAEVAVPFWHWSGNLAGGTQHLQTGEMNRAFVNKL